MSDKLFMPGQSLCYGRGLCENFLNIPYSLREKGGTTKEQKTAGAEGDDCFPGGAPLGRKERSQRTRQTRKKVTRRKNSRQLQLKE